MEDDAGLLVIGKPNSDEAQYKVADDSVAAWRNPAAAR
jgi:hypothetical protein